MVLSALHNVLVDVEKFFKGTGTSLEKFGNAFVKLFKKLPNALQVVDNFVTLAAPEITAAVALVDPIAEPEVAGALSLVETGLAAIEAAAANANSGQSLLENLQNFANSVPSVLSAVQVKNPALQAAITRISALVVGEAKVLIPAVQMWVEKIKASQPADLPALKAAVADLHKPFGVPGETAAASAQ